MTEQEWMEKIVESAEGVKIPEAISPEAVRERLCREAEGDGAARFRKSRRKKGNARRFAAVAATTAILCGAGLYGILGGWGGGRDASSGSSMSGGEAAQEEMAVSGEGDAADGAAADSAANGAAANGAAADSTAGAADAGGRLFPSDSNPSDAEGGANDGTGSAGEGKSTRAKKDAGDLYVIAADYGAVYDLLEENEMEAVRDLMKFNSMDAGAAADTATSGEAMEEFAQDVATAESAAPESAEEEESAEGGSYSTTNLQTEGVDESDIIKTDGDYIYVVRDGSVKIVDARAGALEEAAEISIAMGSAYDRVEEMYVDGDTLNLILEKEHSALRSDMDGGAEKAQDASGDGSAAETQDASGDGSANTAGAVADVYYFGTERFTELVTYDISDPEKPVLKGTVTQDGSYKTSRKIGGIVYLFTEKYMEKPMLERTDAIKAEYAGEWIPRVNGSAIASDSIYLPEQGSQGLILSSTDVGKPDEVIDSAMIVNDYVEVYVSTDSVYLYGEDYSDGGWTTQIAKFSLAEGEIDAVGATSAAGSVTDTFAINAYQGKLRLLVTDYTDGTSNSLYLFDENLELTGKLTGLAEGEDIYAARYFGDTAYFVTYRNTDPLFAVDLSDEKNPKVLSELEITGFSEYLHFWGEDKLVGIGYETDPDTSAQKGMKLTMFDISNPADLKAAGTCVIENLDYSPALYEYKCVLADAGENLIGFAAESYQERGTGYSYLLFSWEDGEFRELLTESLGYKAATEQYRGLYIGGTFYVASPDGITSYDREDGYRMLKRLDF